jgi:hypothetical protein
MEGWPTIRELGDVDLRYAVDRGQLGSNSERRPEKGMLWSMNNPAPAGKAVLLIAGIVIVTVASVLAQNQPAAAQMAFEVATIKLAASDAAPKNQLLRVSPNRISIPSMTLSWLIYTAYGEGMNTSVGLRGGPEWRNRTAY